MLLRMPWVDDPVPPSLALDLRRAVLAHVREAVRWPPGVEQVRVGRPGTLVRVFERRPAEPAPDHALRTDVVAALLHGARRAGCAEPLVWLARSGSLEVEDTDLAWLAAATQAAGELDVPLTMVVVCRQGWRDPRSGVERRWKRLRQRGPVRPRD